MAAILLNSLNGSLRLNVCCIRISLDGCFDGGEKPVRSTKQLYKNELIKESHYKDQSSDERDIK